MQLEQYIRTRLETKPICLMTHVIAGYPSYSDNLRELEIMAHHNVDLVEVQMPFSEPIADGPLFTKANQEALKRGATVNRYFEFFKQAAAQFDFPLLMMGYYNPVLRMGEMRFLERLREAGGQGFILPDLPIEEGHSLYERAKQQQLAPISFMTPTTSDDRLQQLGKAGSGFLYVVARRGVTGQHTSFGESFHTYMQRCRQATSLPLAVGFGIAKKEDIDFLIGQAEIAVIGTAVLKIWESDGADGLKKFLQALRG